MTNSKIQSPSSKTFLRRSISTASVLISLSALVFATGCSDSDGEGGGSGGSDATGGAGGGDGSGGSNATGGAGGDTGEEMTTLSISLQNLAPLGGGFEYEGWFVSEDGPVSAGRFNLAEGETEAEVMIPAMALDGAMTYVLTIEPPLADDDPAPSHTHVLAGSWSDDNATLTIDHAAALGDDFSSATGNFFLETPTTHDNADDYSQGIWFITPGMPMSAGFSLPTLPEGWAYEGWVAGPDGPVSTGTFLDPALADDDGAGEAAGDDGAPPFPGQDFIDPAMDLLDGAYKAVLSVEPHPDDSPMPFAFKPLVGDITDEGAGGVQMLANMADNRPAGTVSIK